MTELNQQPLAAAPKERRGWTVGVNAPGYMPDMEPYTVSTFNAAFLALQEELVRTREALYDDDPNNGADSRLDDAVESVCHEYKKHGEEPILVLAFGLAHWIVRAEP